MKADNTNSGMIYTFKEVGKATVGDILEFLAAASKDDCVAVVPASCLPLLTRDAGCSPNDRGTFIFAQPALPRQRCGCGERVAAGLLLLVLLPVLMVVALLIFFFDGMPVIFRQERYGNGGVPFTLFKFRTMMRRSERLHGRLQRKSGKVGHLFKLERDPRVTRLGGILRRTFLDELPQLANVAKGEMRFVGPRPLPASDQGHFTRPYHALRLQGIPGITGLWQVAGRNERTFDEMCLLDYYYLCNRSFLFDLWISLRTVGVVCEQIGLKRETQRGGQQAGQIEGTSHQDQQDRGDPRSEGEGSRRCE